MPGSVYRPLEVWNITLKAYGSIGRMPACGKSDLMLRSNTALKLYRVKDWLQTFRVEIRDGVDVGVNSVVDRGSWRDTVIDKGAMIDTLVHVGKALPSGSASSLCTVPGLAGLRDALPIAALNRLTDQHQIRM